MIRDRYGCVWAGRADLARDWGGDVAAVVWGDLLRRYHPTRTIVEGGGSRAWTRPAPRLAGMTSSP